MPDFWADPSVLWVSPKDMKSAVIIDSEDKINILALDASAVKLIEASALLFVVRSGILRRTLPTAVLGKQATVNQDIRALTPLIPDLTSYLYYISQGFNDHIRTSCMKSGTTVESIEVPLLQQYSFPLPPLPEQHRIVAKLEELFSKLDAGVAAVRRTQALLKRYRQSVLHAAVTGELTRAWREAHPPAPAETGAALLQRIRAERRAQWEAAQVAKRGGQLPLGEGWKAKYAEPEAVDTAGLPELPEGWVWAPFEQLGSWTGGGTPSKSNPEFWASPDVLWISPKDMKSWRLTDSEDKISFSAVEESSAKMISAPSLLFVVRSGILRRILPVAVLDEPGTVNQDIRALTPYKAEIVDFLLYAVQGLNDDIRTSCMKGGTTVESIEVPLLQRYPVPLPPLAEQAEIVAEVERRLTVLDALSQTLTHELRRAERLRQSILHRAFTGRLVPQEATDEPAAALIARLREGVAGAVPAKGRKTKGEAASTKEKKPRGRKPADATQIDFSFSGK